MASHSLQDRVEYALARALERAIVHLPAGAADPVGRGIGGLVRRPFGIRRGVVAENLRRAFPDAGDEWIERTVRQSYAHLGREVVAMIRLSRLSAAEIIALTDVPAWPEVEAVVAEGKGALVVTGHFGNWEVGAAAVAARGVPISAIVKPQRNRLVDRMVQDARARLGIGTIPIGRAAREVPRLLARGGVVGIVGDQDARRKGLFVPFFGVPASTFRGPAQFALRFDAAVFASTTRRLADDRYLVQGTRIPVHRTGDAEADEYRLTAALAANLEEAIRAAPEQYFWFHKRWKTRPSPEL